MALRRIPADKAAAIVGLRAANASAEDIAERLGVSRSTVYNYLARVQALADGRFIEELELQLEAMEAIHRSSPDLLPATEQARRLAALLSRHLTLPWEAVCQAILNANWRVIQACRRRRPST
jgi:AcrR family transcriptional regulator